MEMVFIVLLGGLTSFIAYQCTKRMRRATAGSLQHAVAALFEWIGAFALFFAANIAIGACCIFLIRGLTPRFVALYALENVLLLILSGVQAFIFQHWWNGRDNSGR